MKKTVVLGASSKPDRYSYKAVVSLVKHGHPVVAIGARKGIIEGEPILTEWTDIEGVDTVTLYLNQTNQKTWESAIMALNPKRVIFNPGAENPDFEEKLNKLGIKTESACTLVLLSTGQY